MKETIAERIDLYKKVSEKVYKYCPWINDGDGFDCGACGLTMFHPIRLADVLYIISELYEDYPKDEKRKVVLLYYKWKLKTDNLELQDTDCLQFILDLDY